MSGIRQEPDRGDPGIRRAIEAVEALEGILPAEVRGTVLSVLRDRMRRGPGPGVTGEGDIRRQASILFADITGFTSISESLDPEHVTDAVNSLWIEVDGVIRDHGGWIDKHIGDAVMAVWGMGRTREDDPVRAVRAALALQERIRLLRESWPRPFRMRAAVHTGLVYIGRVGTTGEYTAIGDAVNTASRLQSAAPPDGVLISGDTSRLVRGAFETVPVEPLSLHGKSRRIDACLVTGVSGAGRIERGIPGISSGLVGRRGELEALVGHAGRCATGEGSPLLTVLGEAGMGKSRLSDEFLRALRPGSGDAPMTARATCSPDSGESPMSLFRDALGSMAGVSDSDPPAVLLDKLRAAFGGEVPAEDAALAGSAAGFDLSSVESVRRLSGSASFGGQARAALSRVLGASADRQGLLMILDDIHWADEASLEFLSGLAASPPSARLAIVCLARPTLLERLPDWSRTGRVIELHPLSASESGELVSTLLTRRDLLPEGLVEAIASASEGNPYYAEEMLRMMIEEGVLTRADGCWTSTVEDFGGMDVPTTLTGILQARLDMLDLAERRLLQKASVIGRQFWDGALAGLDETGCSPLLESLEGRGLVLQNGSTTFDGTLEYLFRHSLLRDVAYGTVLLKLRRTYHSRVARWLSSASPGRSAEHSPVIAGHFDKAGEAPEAVRWYVVAGDRARRISSFADALRCYRRASELLSDGSDEPARARCLHGAGNCLEKLGRYDEARETLREALEMAGALGDPLTESLVLSTLTWITGIIEGMRPAEELARRALDAAERSGDPLALARAVMRMADYEEEPLYEKHLPYYLQARERYGAAGDRHGVALALLNAGNSAMRFGMHEEARRWYRESLEIYREIGDRWGQANCLGNLGNVEAAAGAFGEAAALHLQSRDMSDSIGDVEGVVICHLNMADDCARLDDRPGLAANLARCLDLAVGVGLMPLAMEAAMRLCLETGGGAVGEVLRQLAVCGGMNDRVESIVRERFPGLPENSSGFDPDGFRTAVRALLDEVAGAGH